MSANPILALPTKLRWTIYRLAFGSELKIELFANDRFLSPNCPLLRVNKASRMDVLAAYSQQTMRTVWIFKSPEVLANFSPLLHASALHPRIESIQLVLLAPLGDGSQLEHSELGGSSQGPNVEPIYRAWRDTVAGLPLSISMRCVRFDLTHPWTWQSLSIARLVHVLSAVIDRKSKGKVKFSILGCKTEEGRRFIEQSTMGLAEVSGVMAKRRGVVIGAE